MKLQTCDHTISACLHELDLWKQKQSKQPLGLSRAKPNVPGLHASHFNPSTFS